MADITSGHNVRSTVFIEARSMYAANLSPDDRPIGEVDYVQGIAAASASGIYGDSRAAASIIGHANLNLGEKVRPLLERLALASDRFKGIRHSVTWDPHPEVENTALHKRESQLVSKDFQAGAKVLSDMGMSFEAWLYFHQLPELLEFAKAVPDLKIILNHIGGLVMDGPYSDKKDEVISIWREGIASVAECPNVVVKLGGIGMPRTGFDWHERKVPIDSEELADSIAPFFDYCIEHFGTDRSMFESNFPVDKVSFSYPVLYNAFKRYSKEFSGSERAAMFHDNAVDVYKISI
jgi:predicted TIM-barrel fold metal-dependent hydrolase